MDVLESLSLRYSFLYKGRKQWEKDWIRTFEEILVKTRINFPSDKVTLNISKWTKNKSIHWLNTFFKLNGKHGVKLTMEDSKRNSNFLLFSSFISS